MLGDHGYVVSISPRLELLHRGSPKSVTRSEHHTLSVFFEPTGQFADGGGLAGAVYPDDQDNKRLMRGDVQRLLLFGE